MDLNMNKKKILITETILRDAHQSQAATRMRLEEMIPVLEQLDKIGYYSLEAWGGATFDSCLRYLNEDPWERLRTLKKYLKNTPIQMLLRGQNLLGYRHYADDLVEKFVEKSIENGVGVIRVFDALNDPRNLETSMSAIKKYGGVCEATICYTTGPVYTKEYFVELGKRLENMGADNICLKDMANLLLPFDAYELIKALREELRPETKIHLHTHNTTGTGDMTYLMAIQAGVDIVDTALSPLGNGTSQPATEPLVATLKDTPYDTGIDIEKLLPIVKHFKGVEQRLKNDGILTEKVKGIDVNTFFFTSNPDDEEDRLILRSRAANSRLGYVYQADPDSPTGNRFCINSAALKFIPYEELEAAGYGYLKFLFDEAQDTGYTSTTPQRAKELMDAGGAFVVDVREEHEYQESHIPGAISLPLSEMTVESGEEITEDKDGVILIYCRNGNRSKTAASYFVDMGYTNVYEFGGILGWPYEVVKG